MSERRPHRRVQGSLRERPLRLSHDGARRAHREGQRHACGLDGLRGRQVHRPAPPSIPEYGRPHLLRNPHRPAAADAGFLQRVRARLRDRRRRAAAGDRQRRRTPRCRRRRPVHGLVVIKATDRRRYERELVEAEIGASERGLRSERETAELREQFIAVLGHDLRNPLAAISAGARILQRSGALQDRQGASRPRHDQHDRHPHVGPDRQRSRFRARPAGRRHHPRAATPTDRWSRSWSRSSTNCGQHRPSACIETSFAITEPVNCDRTRIGQLVSNLIGNALTHGAADQPVRVGAKTEDGVFELWVANAGEPIPAAAMEKLFEPFFRGDVRASRQGLGLGLHIASQIAQAHGGRIDVTSTPDETRFVFRMPLQPG